MEDEQKCFVCEMTMTELSDEGYSLEETKFEKMETFCNTNNTGEDSNSGEFKEFYLCGKCRRCSRCSEIVTPGEEVCYTYCTCTTDSNAYPTIHCEECESDGERLEWCNICEEHVYEDQLCRHLYKPDDFEVQGGGGWGDSCGYYEGYLKPAIFEMLGYMGYKFALDFKLTIHKGKLGYDFISSWGSMLGHQSVSITTCDAYGKDHNHDDNMYGKRMTCFSDYCEMKEDKFGIENISDSFWWIYSLDKKSIKENELTISWIDEWLKTKNARAEILKHAATQLESNCLYNLLINSYKENRYA